MIVNDQLVVRDGLRMLIENHPGTKVVAMASTRSEALEIIEREPCDLIILDLELGGYNASSFIPQLREAAKNARVLVLTGSKDSETHQKAAQLGAMGVVLKEDAADQLIKAIEKVYRGEAWLDRVTLGTLLWNLSNQDKDSLDPRARKISTLTDRERQVITLIAEGLKNRQIAERLFISPTTVTHHLSSIYSKLGVSDRLELVIYAFANKLVKLPE
ncbi:MAG TPA: response regulator transcription factor [Pyrinomonadaceae bacterium]|nr:response regulator transcription factor [Pyrinomonadaceae bacterium]